MNSISPEKLIELSPLTARHLSRSAKRLRLLQSRRPKDRMRRGLACATFKSWPDTLRCQPHSATSRATPRPSGAWSICSGSATSRFVSSASTCWLPDGEIAMERVFIGVSRAGATRKADEWWGRQKGLRQTLRTEVAVGGKGPNGQLTETGA